MGRARYLVHLFAVISVHILAGNVGVKLFELTKVLPRCVSRFDLVIVAYSIEEAYRVNGVHGHQRGFFQSNVCMRAFQSAFVKDALQAVGLCPSSIFLLKQQNSCHLLRMSEMLTLMASA